MPRIVDKVETREVFGLTRRRGEAGSGRGMTGEREGSKGKEGKGKAGGKVRRAVGKA